MKIQLVSQYDDLVQIKEQWNELLNRSLNPIAVLTHQWIDSWWKAFGEGNELFILLVYDGDILLAIAPLMISNSSHTIIEKTNTAIRAKKIEFIANVHSNRSDLILTEKPAEACDAVVNFILHDHKSSWDLVSLEYLVGNSPTVDYLKKSLDRQNIHYKQYSLISSPYVLIDGKWNDYFRKRQKRLKEQLSSRFKKLQAAGNVSIENYRHVDELGVVLDKIFDVASKSWKAKEGTALSSTPKLKEFYTNLAYAAAKENWLELFIIYLNEQPIIFQYCLKFNNKLLLLKTEFDETYREFEIGKIIQWKILESIFEKGFTEFDFMGPSDFWKKQWSDGNEREHITFYAFNRSLRGHSLYIGYCLKDFVKNVLGKLTTKRENNV